MQANSLAGYVVRGYRAEDRAAASRLGMHVIDWWHAKGAEASLHLVAEQETTGEIVGHLQAVDYSVPEPSRRPGHCHFALNVAPEHRRRGVGGALYAAAESFARRRAAHLIYTAYIDHEDAPAAPFLKSRGFEPLEWYCPSYLELDRFDPARFTATIQNAERQGIRLLTYADAGDSPDNRRKLYELEQSARAAQPFREVDPYIPEPFARWEQEFTQRDPATIFLAICAPDQVWAGVVTGLEWYFTGVHPAWQGRGIATALKVRCLVAAKERRIGRMETENHADNHAMIAINRKLGFIFTTPEVACVKRF